MGCTQSSEGRLEKAEVLFFDLDDTLYQNSWATAERLKASIERYTVEELGLAEEEAFNLYLEHGTALRGLIKERHLPEDKIEHFLQDVHNISLEEVGPRPELRKMLLKLGHKRRVVFTASIREHAERCLERLGISDLFEDIIDSRRVGLVTKHDPMAFVKAMEAANVTDPKTCVLFDDSVKNMRTAKEMGFITCLVGLRERGTDLPIQCPSADYAVQDLLELPVVMPGLFKGSRPAVPKALKPSGKASEAMVSQPTPADNELVSDQGGDQDDDEEEEEKEDIVDEAPAATTAPRHSIRASLRRLSSKPRVKADDRLAIVVLGGPGSGKGSQCSKLVQSIPDVTHLSAGDLLREERAKPDSELGQVIDNHIREGSLVPAEITMRLLENAMAASSDRVFLIDGCPRDMHNYHVFKREILDSGVARLAGVLFFDCDEEQLLARIMARAEASQVKRADDNVETAKKRFATFRESTMPVVDFFRGEDLLYEIDATGSIDEVFEHTHSTVNIMIKGHTGAAL